MTATEMASKIVSHAHFRAFLAALKPENRKAVYDSLAPLLSFKAKSFGNYIANSRNGEGDSSAL